MIAKLAFDTEESVGIFEATLQPDEPDTAELEADERLVHAAVIRLPEEAFE